MRIGILTFHFSHNVGSALQAYALRKYIMSIGKGVECDVINYEKEGWLPSSLALSKNSTHSLGGV